MKKRLCGLITAVSSLFLFSGSAFAQNNFYKIDDKGGDAIVCKGFSDYLGELPVYTYGCDKNGDKKPDFLEIYPLIGGTGNPLIYVYDNNEDGELDFEKTLIDPEMDGINGNEEFLIQTKESNNTEI